ncbi:MAG: hypothetical protein F6K35_06790 [Okeania sp. SIO2H7]|nr:hypothetical protein [Okeania sp. SIO2H7]
MNELFEDWLFLTLDPNEASYEDGYRVNEVMQGYCEQSIRPREAMDKLESLGVKEPHILIANQFEIMEVELSKRMK